MIPVPNLRQQVVYINVRGLVSIDCRWRPGLTPSRAPRGRDGGLLEQAGLRTRTAPTPRMPHAPLVSMPYPQIGRSGAHDARRRLPGRWADLGLGAA